VQPNSKVDRTIGEPIINCVCEDVAAFVYVFCCPHKVTAADITQAALQPASAEDELAMLRELDRRTALAHKMDSP
jgi:hypothetical protein